MSLSSCFNQTPDRRGTDSIKWGKYAGKDILPLWVADMDFPAPPPVLAALEKRLAHGVFGYAHPTASVVDAVVGYLHARYSWAIDPRWLVWLPGLVTGLNVACRAVPGDVLTAVPVYPPFLSAPRLSGKSLIEVPLLCEEVGNGYRWGWSLPALEKAASQRSTADNGLFLLCHPHNPVGRAWQEEELYMLADYAQAHSLVVCSDEIHCDLVLAEGRLHRPFATLSAEAAERSITLMAPSKTFNVPGLGCAFAVIPNPALRRAFQQVMEGIVPHVNVFGMVACEAAYREGEAWHAALIDHLRQQRDAVLAAVADIPRLRMGPVEATYLAWLDLRGLGLDDPVKYLESHGLGLSDGRDFGAPGWGRLNFGCSHSTLSLALDRLRFAVDAC